MAKDRKKLIHMHSSVSDKQPTPASLEVGELAVNFSADKEFVSLKNSNNRVVRISSDEQMIDWMEYKTVIPYSGTVDNINLASNRSNIEIKFNQLVPNNTKFHEKVNGAVDIDGRLINPTDDSGLTNGAGFNIDTSVFVLNGSNPSFSSVTSSCNTKLFGTTEIKGSDGSCGSLLDIAVKTKNIDANTATTNVATAVTNIVTDVTKISDSILVLGSENKNVSGNSIISIDGNSDETINGTTTLLRRGSVTENNSTDYTINTTGNTAINTNGNAIIATNGDETISVSGDSLNNIKGLATVNAGSNLCLNSNANASLYGELNTNIGTKCDGTISNSTNIDGNSININGHASINSGLTVNGNTVLNDGLASGLEWTYGSTANADSGKTNFSGNSTSSIIIPKDASHISRKTLSIDYLALNESMSDFSDTTYDPGDVDNVTAHTPAYVSNLGRGTLKVEYKSSQCSLSNVSDQLYDPGSKAAFSGEVANTIYIPKTIEALDNACGECISISKDVCVEGKISATEGVYQSSDKSLKENVKYFGIEDAEKAKEIQFVTFNYKNDADRRKMYGVIAQDIEKIGLNELVHYDEKGLRAVDYTGLLILKFTELEYEFKKLSEEYNKLKMKLENK